MHRSINQHVDLPPQIRGSVGPGEEVRRVSVNAGEFLYNNHRDPLLIYPLGKGELRWLPHDERAGFYFPRPADWNGGDVYVTLFFQTASGNPGVVDFNLIASAANPGSGDTLTGIDRIEAESSVAVNGTELQLQTFVIESRQMQFDGLWGFFFQRGWGNPEPNDETFNGEVEVFGAVISYVAETDAPQRNRFVSGGAFNFDHRGPVVRHSFADSLRWDNLTSALDEGGFRLKVPSDFPNHGLSEIKLYFATPSFGGVINWRLRYVSLSVGGPSGFNPHQVNADAPLILGPGDPLRIYAQSFTVSSSTLAWGTDLTELYFRRGDADNGEFYSFPLRVLGAELIYDREAPAHHYRLEHVNAGGLTFPMGQDSEQYSVHMRQREALRYERANAAGTYWTLLRPAVIDPDHPVLIRVLFFSYDDSAGAVQWRLFAGTGQLGGSDIFSGPRIDAEEIIVMSSALERTLLAQDFCVPASVLADGNVWKFTLARGNSENLDSYQEDLNVFGITAVYRAKGTDALFSSRFEASVSSTFGSPNCEPHKVVFE